MQTVIVLNGIDVGDGVIIPAGSSVELIDESVMGEDLIGIQFHGRSYVISRKNVEFVDKTEK